MSYIASIKYDDSQILIPAKWIEQASIDGITEDHLK